MAEQKLKVNIIGDASNLTRALNSASGRLQSFGSTVSNVGKKLSTRLTLPLGIAGGVALKSAANFEKLKTLPGIGDYTATAILAIAFNKPFIPLDGNIERVLKRYFYLKKTSQISKDYLIKKKKLLGVSKRSSDYAQALMELGALICKPKNPSCTECPLINSCKSFLKKDFVLTKIKKINKSKYFELSIIKKNNKYLLIKNNKFNFLKNFIIFPMIETKASSKFKKDLNIKISNMTMYIQIKFGNFYTNTSNAIWIDPGKLNNYTLPTFTKKIFRHLKNKI